MFHIEDIIARINSHKNELGITLYPPATENDITAFETVFGMIPEDMKMMYRFCNGFESAEDMFRIVPLHEIVEFAPKEERTLSGIFHFAEYMTYCDSWEISIDSADKNNYFIYNKSYPSPILTHSLAEFISIFLDRGVFDGLYEWRERMAYHNDK